MAKEREVRVRIDDILPEGNDVEFSLDLESLNERVGLSEKDVEPNQVQPPAYVFNAAPGVKLHLDLETSTVVVRGNVHGEFTTTCARCAEDAKQEIDIPLDLVLKPHAERSTVGAEEEDLHYGVYDGEVVECTKIAEEFLILALPFTAVCGEECKGLCSKCGKNLNLGDCGCQPEEQGDPRFSVLRQLKLVH